ncbi:hypothetical protein AMATHDRAFT_2487 [Amanita thiersii Skay4041]|uniref:HbrB-like protein n=1 Tax=Amanita thiersii Skay4041 TaxID=703135 RepID=A0A2A9NPG4_9AGAR|nr:hypothetical protein AMATHDRAFT_2487 [Amanita thiersii Skay4041]
MVAGWSSFQAHIHTPRRSHEQLSRSPTPPDGDERTERHRRSSTDDTPRPTPATTRFINTASGDQNQNKALPALPSSVDPSQSVASVSTPRQRLAFFSEKLSSSLSVSSVHPHHTHPSSGTTIPSKGPSHTPTLLNPHSRADLSLFSGSSVSISPNMTSVSTVSSVSKSHTSPSKAPYNRTYDSKLVTREMHRLGVPSPLAPSISNISSVASLSLPAPSAMTPVLSQSTSTDPWRSLHVHVLPLFNGEPLRIPIEDLNTLVKRHIQAVVSSSPPRALVTLETDASELIASGMVTLNAKLTEIDDEKLVVRVVEIWGFFWDNVLTYVEGVLLPLQTDPLLSSLYRTPKSHHRAASPNRQGSTSSSLPSSISNVSPTHIDVRSIALRSFRDKVIVPLFERLYARLALPNRHDNFQEANTHQQPRLQQMLLVLSAQSRDYPTALSLTAPTPQPSVSEAAIRDLLRVVRSPYPQIMSRFGPVAGPTRTPSFLSGGVPRDRRGRIAQKRKSTRVALSNLEDESFDETPRSGSTFTILHMERERERELLESSPDAESAAGRGSTGGGWGLGEGHVEAGKEEEEDEPLDWDQAQAIVERMIGMTPPSTAESRRKGG